jgi:hypothetical protein
MELRNSIPGYPSSGKLKLKARVTSPRFFFGTHGDRVLEQNGTSASAGCQEYKSARILLRPQLVVWRLSSEYKAQHRLWKSCVTPVRKPQKVPIYRKLLSFFSRRRFPATLFFSRDSINVRPAFLAAEMADLFAALHAFTQSAGPRSF